MASEEHNTTVKRRAYRKKGWKYLLDDDDHTAWIAKGHIGRCRRFRVPDHVMIEGVRYTITSIEIGAFKSQKTFTIWWLPHTGQTSFSGFVWTCK